jgi:hypothetical protein
MLHYVDEMVGLYSELINAHHKPVMMILGDTEGCRNAPGGESPVIEKRFFGPAHR